jgi:tetratricopeptide (TPR) repeat protein
VPRELPPAAAHFTGRARELAELTGLLGRPGQEAPGAVVISAIGGSAGVGKTALAVHWAHQVTRWFPDGQLYVNLRGHDPGQPVPAIHALAGLLRSLGVSGHDIPPDQDDRAARYRSLLAGRRMLIVLDNAGSAEQVRPLLPATPGCVVVVTSRDALAGLVARDGAARLDLDVLPLDEAVALLRELIGARANSDPAATAELAEQCCRLPLALRVAAELATSRPAAPLAALTGELADLRTRLDLLDAGGDPRTQLRAVFSWSCHHLDADAARTFRLLGLHPGPDLEPYAAAALTGTTVPQTRRALDALVRAHLVSAAEPGRYGMHDLLRAYSRELTATPDTETETERRAAQARLLDYYLYAAATAMDTLFPAERHHRPRIPRLAAPVPALAEPGPARDWLDAERATLVALVGFAAAGGWPSHAVRLAPTLGRYLCNGGYVPEALTAFGHALAAARHTGDRAAQAEALNDIGLIDWLQNRYHQAADRHREALALARAAGDKVGQAQTLGNLGLDETQLGRYTDAVRHQQQALVIYRDLGDRFGEGRALGNLGYARQQQHRYTEAADYHQQSLDSCRQAGDRQGQARALGHLGVIRLRQGRCQQAAGCLGQALVMFRELADPSSEARMLTALAEAYAGLGRSDEAAASLDRALAICRRISEPAQEADAHNGLADLLLQTEPGQARAHYAAALQLATQAAALPQQARAHAGLARASQAADGDGRMPAP